MDKLFPSTKIYLSNSFIPKAGRGVFSIGTFHKEETIEICPVIEIPKNQIPLLIKTELVNYFFSWDKHFDAGAICLGFGSMYNHSYSPNAMYIKRVQESLIEFVALREIKKHEEITVNYNGKPDDTRRLWIKSIPPHI